MAISNPSLTQIKQALTEMLPKLKPLSVPTGMISAFNNVPEGWLQCNGAAVSRTTYAALFAVIGTKYGSGNGSTTFNLPNLHHKFIEGTNTTSEVGQSVSAGLPNISGEGDWVFGGYASTGTFTGSMYHVSLQNLPGATGGNDYYNGKPGIGIDASRSSSIYKASSTVQPASVRLLACIKI